MVVGLVVLVAALLLNWMLTQADTSPPSMSTMVLVGLVSCALSFTLLGSYANMRVCSWD